MTATRERRRTGLLGSVGIARAGSCAVALGWIPQICFARQPAVLEQQRIVANWPAFGSHERLALRRPVRLLNLNPALHRKKLPRKEGRQRVGVMRNRR